MQSAKVRNARPAGWIRSKTIRDLHPAWQEFVTFCEQLEFGEIERLKIQNGLPVAAELTRKKVKFI